MEDNPPQLAYTYLKAIAISKYVLKITHQVGKSHRLLCMERAKREREREADIKGLMIK